MYKVERFTTQEKQTEDFLALPRCLYTKKTLVQNEDEERKILSRTHLLSKYFDSYNFIVYNSREVPCARFVITAYSDEETAYIGFFECVNSSECARAAFDEAKRFSRELGYKKLTGPVNASFWITYRLKVNLFENGPYVSEPYNREYYPKLFTENGFDVIETYVSNIYNHRPENYRNDKYNDRFKDFTDRGYKIVSPARNELGTVIGEVYDMLIELYSDFPVFRHIEKEDFVEIFMSYKPILDLSMVKMAYYEGKPAAFFIGMPDYKNLLYGKLTPTVIAKMLIKRRRCERYVMLYLGVRPEHRGLGKAITQPIIEAVFDKQATAIGAFIKQGKVTERYVEDLIDDKYKYVLLESSL